MNADPRLPTFLALAQERPEQSYYAAAAYTLARQCNDVAAMSQALALGAADWRPEPCVYARAEEEPEGKVIQLMLFEEAA